jgi:predicted transcriptional regulator
MRTKASLTIALDQELLDAIDDLAEEQDMTRSQWVRRAIRNELRLELPPAA